jgi:hypothetical protein
VQRVGNSELQTPVQVYYEFRAIAPKKNRDFPPSRVFWQVRPSGAGNSEMDPRFFSSKQLGECSGFSAVSFSLNASVAVGIQRRQALSPTSRQVSGALPRRGALRSSHLPL